jgi:hypothetical protein
MAIVIATVAATPARAPDTIRCNTFSRDDIAKRQFGAIVPEYLFGRRLKNSGVSLHASSRRAASPARDSGP